MNAMVEKIFLSLSKRFQGGSLTNADISELPLRALKLVTRLSTTAVATKSYELFRTIMRSGVAQEKKMEAARLTLHAAYRPGLKPVPHVGDPKHILVFLRYHIDPHVKPEDRTHAIDSAMRAIDSVSDDPTSQPWTCSMENAGELLTWFEQSPHPKEFKWWYKVLWLHYGGLAPDVQSGVDKIAMGGDDRIDLELCRSAIEKEIERVKRLNVAPTVATLEDAHRKLAGFIDHRKVCDELSGI
jgi:hypothetical protein